MNTRSVVQDIVDAFADLSDPKRIEKSKTYFPTSMKVMGVTNPTIQLIIKELKIRFQDWNEQDWIGLCKALVAMDIFECQVLAYELIGRDKKLLNALQYKDLTDLGKNLDNWASVDHYTVGIYGVLWGKGVVRDDDITRLLASSNFWKRRIAVVATVALNLKSRGGKGDTARTLWVCEQVADDHRDMIQKALSWALRELSKRDRQAVEQYMERHEFRLARRVIKEVNHKLEFGTKN